jgi:integrase
MSDKRRQVTSDPNIILYPNGRYYYRRGDKEVSLKTKSFKEALNSKRLLEAKDDDILRMSLSIRVRDAAREYLIDRENDFLRGDIRGSTLLHSKKYLDPIVDLFGSVPVAKLDSVKWESEKRKIKGNSIVNLRSVLSHFMKWCVKRGYRTTLPIFEVGRITRRPRRILKPFEVEAIWAHAEGNLRIFLMLALGLGMRRSEVMTLEWAQVSFEEGAIFLPASKTKTKKDRYVTMPPSVVEALRARKKLSSSEWVFPNALDPKRHADKSGLKTAWHTCLKKAGLGKGSYTWHDLRATCEQYAHKRKDVTDTQLEKYFGASADVQRRIYVQGGIDFVRGVENTALLPQSQDMGKTRGKEQ